MAPGVRALYRKGGWDTHRCSTTEGQNGQRLIIVIIIIGAWMDMKRLLLLVVESRKTAEEGQVVEEPCDVALWRRHVTRSGAGTE